MGWTGIYTYNLPYKNGKVDRKAFLDKEFTWETEDRYCKVLKSAMVGTTYYAALQNNKGEVFALVVLTKGKCNRDDSCGLYYKDMTEHDGPYYYDCPKGILQMLTPTDNERANQWRKQCEKHLADKAAERKNGKEIPQIEGLEFTNMRQKYVISSIEYRRSHWYTGVRYLKRWNKTPLEAIRKFVNEYGTDEQKAALAEIEAKEGAA